MRVQTTGLVALTILAYSRYNVCLTMDPSVCSYIGIYIDSLSPLVLLLCRYYCDLGTARLLANNTDYGVTFMTLQVTLLTLLTLGIFLLILWVTLLTLGVTLLILLTLLNPEVTLLTLR